MEKFKIVADSSADVFESENVSFGYAPLKIITSEKEFTDNENLDLKQMVNYLSEYKGKSSTSCPNSSEWLEAFGNAENIFCVPITGTLSGSYNSAKIAKNMYEELHPERRVFVVNTLSAGPELKLIIEKLEELILQNLNFEEICEQITAYTKKTSLLFMLESMKNLSNNGRVKPLVAKAAGLLGIRVIGKASDKGDLEPLHKCKGQERSVHYIAEKLKEFGCKNGKIRISHCFNLEAAQRLKEILISILPDPKIKIYNCKGLCSFYAEKGGLLVGFEQF